MSGSPPASVLVVDDRAINREFLATLLRHGGYRVREAVDGVQALALIERERPDLVVTDLVMPNMDGVALARALRALPATAELPIVFYTATYRLEDARELAQACGVADVLGKPAEPQQILDLVRRRLPPTSEPLPLPAAAELLARQKAMQDALGERMQALAAGHAGDPHGDPGLRSTFEGLQTLSLRLAAILELGLELAHERDPDRLLQTVCGAARNILVANRAGLCVDIDSARPWRLAIRGLDAAEAASVRAALDPRAGLLGRVARDRNARRLRPAPSVAELGLPDAHPPVADMLIVPVESGSGIRGWLYLADKLDRAGFSAEDEQFAEMLAAQVAAAYENLALLAEVRQHAGRLEAEIVERRQVAARLAESEHRFRQLAETVNEAFFLFAMARNQLLYLSPAFQRIWGRSSAVMVSAPERWIDDVDRRDRPRVEREVLLAEPPGQFDSEFRILRPDGAERWVRLRGFPVHGPQGTLQRVAGLIEDVTERREHEERIARLSRIYAVLSGINSAIVRIRDRSELLHEACRIAVDDGEFVAAWIGSAHQRPPQVVAAALRGSEGAEPCALDWPRAADHPANRALRSGRAVIVNDTAALPADQQQALFDGRSLAALPIEVDGAVASVLLLSAAEPGAFDEQELRLLRELAGDIGFGLQYIAKEEGLNYLAFYDPLTGLANSTLFLDRLRQLIAVARPSGERVAVIALDLERFTQVNDSLGRQAGDTLLRMVAERLGKVVDEPFSLARISADAFALALGGLRHRSDAAQLVRNRLLRTIEQPFDIEGADLQLTARAGIAMFPGDGDDAATLFNNAEAALKRAQLSGERFLYYAPQMNAEVAEQLALESALRRALEQQQFRLYYQPKWDIDSGRLIGFEGLARWRDPSGRLIGAGSFMPMIEQSGMILEFGEWALRQALSDYLAWRARGLQPPRIAVNVSALQLHHAEFADRLLRVIDQLGADPSALEIEITETVIMQDIEAGTRTLQRLRDAGICIAVDDFGTGYSSLRYLARLPLDELKIDRSFVVTMLQDDSSHAIVEMVISLAHALELGVIAEGVDACEQADALARMGCLRMQGFLFGKPVPADTAAGMIDGAPPSVLARVRPSISAARPAP